ncbi:uncharacterized protein LOC126903738 [Daktulosphaira vitifoliae]|uniref:uncharacterized protein LOC126903738 n=1 Tax=Daktulosphaira vitifoliae TaxID=58002 RepID=UPI0021AA7519|nr:uncharacterized protein LOC126903738 [Daktulosphaira vitifoliae]
MDLCKVLLKIFFILFLLFFSMNDVQSLIKREYIDKLNNILSFSNSWKLFDNITVVVNKNTFTVYDLFDIKVACDDVVLDDTRATKNIIIPTNFTVNDNNYQQKLELTIGFIKCKYIEKLRYIFSFLYLMLKECKASLNDLYNKSTHLESINLYKNITTLVEKISKRINELIGIMIEILIILHDMDIHSKISSFLYQKLINLFNYHIYVQNIDEFLVKIQQICNQLRNVGRYNCKIKKIHSQIEKSLALEFVNVLSTTVNKTMFDKFEDYISHKIETEICEILEKNDLYSNMLPKNLEYHNLVVAHANRVKYYEITE